MLLLDEPTSAWDGLTASLIGDLARDDVAGGGTVVLVSHDLAVVRWVATTCWCSTLAASGLPREIGCLEAG